MNEAEDETFHRLAPESENLQQSGSEHEIIQKKAARDHTSNVLHSQIVKEQEYRSIESIYSECVPLGERIGNWFYNKVRCGDPESSFVEKLDDVQKNKAAALEQKYNRILNDKILKLKIIETSRLQLDSNVIHPFVKVHIVDKNTGCYIEKKHEQNQPIIYHQEDVTFYDIVDRKYEPSQNNLILPFATTMCDFREMGNSIGLWNQKFYINYPASKLMNPDTLFLFEILDFNHQALLYRDTDIYDRDNYYRVAWGFLRPVGISKTNFGVTKVQLYKYKFNNKKLQENLLKSHIPTVYYDFLWNNHQKYEGFLSVQLTHTIPPKYRLIDETSPYPTNLFEEQPRDPTFIRRISHGLGSNQKEENVEAQQNENLLKFYRNRNICEIPKQLIYKLESQKLGCYRVLFVNNYLFAACSSKNHTCIKVYSLQKGEKVMTMKGHRKMIYSMITTSNEKYLITAGSDHIVRVWEIPASYGEYIDEDESEAYLKGQCIHTAAIYCTASIHSAFSDKLYLMTCCYDGYIRLWQTNLKNHSSSIKKQMLINNQRRTPKKVYPISCTVSQQTNFFIVGDSIGDIRIYDFARDTLNERCHIIHEELYNDEIMHIKILNKNNILVQASDNIIRHFEMSTNKLRMIMKFTGAQFERNLADCAVSPDNRYIIAPSETGKPFMWDLATGTHLSLDHLNLDIKGPLVSCSWHPKYNLVAFAGFVELCPVLIYGNVLSESEQKMVAAKAL